MKKIVCLLIALASCNVSANNENAAVNDGDENADIVTSALDLDTTPYGNPVRSSRTTKGFLENTEIAIGTILKSHHFDDEYDYNESHDGLYININRWSVGTYTNSSYSRSHFITYNSPLYRSRSLTVNFVTGVANGYEGWEHAQGDYLPIVGASARWSYLKAMLSYDVVAVGLELPLN